MSAQDFQNAFTEYLAKVGTYNTSQRGTILNAFKEACADTLEAIGAPLPEQAAAAPAASAAATPAKAAGGDAKGAAGTSVTGAKPSSRVNQNPGGTSSINLGGGDDKPNPHSHRKQLGNSNASSISFGASDDSTKSSVRVKAAPGGGSSIQLGDDSTPSNAAAPKRVDRLDDSGAQPKKAHSRKALATPGGDSHDIFNQKEDGKGAVHTSIKTHHAPGGASSMSLAHDSAAPPKTAEAKVDASANGGGDAVTQTQLKDIIAAVYRKGKVKDTFTKFTGNKGKVMSAQELKDGIMSLGINVFTDAQAASLMARFAADAKAGMTYPEFMKMMSA